MIDEETPTYECSEFIFYLSKTVFIIYTPVVPKPSTAVPEIVLTFYLKFWNPSEV